MCLMCTLLILFSLSVNLFPQGEPDIIFSEVMFNPASGHNEFIELYNQSETESVNLSAFRIKYFTSNPDSIRDAGFGTILPPKSYAVIFEGDYGLDTGIYKNLIPLNALILKIKDNSFGTNGMANTTSRILYLIKSEGDTTQVYTYSANNSVTISDEKILLSGNNSSSDWGNSIKTNGTPGYKNSIAPLLNDITALSLTTSPPLIISGETVTVLMKLKNRGLNILASFSVNLYIDSDNDSIPELQELIYNDEFNNLPPGDTLTLPYEIEDLPAGSYSLILTAASPVDEDSTNNKLIHNFSINSPYNSYNDLVINEIMYAPVSPMSEWIEVFNRSNRNINLKNFTVSDSNTKVKITTDDCFLLPGSFAVISKDSSLLNYFPGIRTFLVTNLPSFNNTDDAVVLKDSLGMIADSLYYLSGWGGGSGGISLERISPDSLSTNSTNWASSVSLLKATPGLKNSVAPKLTDLTLLRFYPGSPYSITGEGNELFIVPGNIGIGTVTNYILKIYNDINKDSIAQPQELLNSFNGSQLQPGDSVEYNLQLTSILPGRNIYIAVIECTGDEDNSNNIKLTDIEGVVINEIRGDLVVNEIMYTPFSPEPEWVEIYNRSQKTINLKNYFVADSKDTNKVFTQEFPLNPAEFLIVAKDSNIYTEYNITSKCIIGNIPQLNNDGDRIMLLDSLWRVIDSLDFKSTWGGTAGKSLERKEIYSPSIDSSGWGSCISPEGGTPGFANSLSRKSSDIELVRLWNTPSLPVSGDNVSISARIKNIGINSINYSLELYTDTNHDTIPDNLIESTQQMILQTGDSADFTFARQITNINSEKSFIVKVIAPGDQNLLNNEMCLTINPGYLPRTIVVNEIMYNPQGGEPEWIELYNRTNDTIDIKNWKVSDVFTTASFVKLTESIKILPHSLFVISKDSTILDYHNSIPSGYFVARLPALNNDKDGVVLIDATGSVIDSLIYFNDWNTSAGKSLERKNTEDSSTSKSNWSGSLDIENSTPGRKNSITPKQYDLGLLNFSSLPSNPIFGDTVRLSVRIKNNGSQSASSFRILFEIDTDSNNVTDFLLEERTGLFLQSGDSLLVTSLNGINNLQSNIMASVKLIWDLDENQFNNSLQKIISPGYNEKVIVINEIMYNPDSGQPEWIELYNRSGETINLKDWLVSDYLSPTTGKVTTADYLLPHGEYLIISKDSSLITEYPALTGKIKVANFGALGNTEDGVFIYDNKGTIIDSVIYYSNWGGEKGFSLERISPDNYSNDSSNWTETLGGEKHTVGRENSFNNVRYYSRNNLVINEIMYEASAVSSEYIEFYNLSEDTLNLGGWTIEDENLNRHKLTDSVFLLPPKEYYLIIADSIILNNFPLLQGEGNKRIAGESDLGLINSGELILLKDAKGSVIDSVLYSDKWHNRSINITVDKSLERINPLLGSNDRGNWSTCVSVEGGTPGKTNSIITGNKNTSSKISLAPNPFSPDNDGWEDFTIINYNLSKNVSQVTVRIFDDRGREVRNLANNVSAGSSGSIVFDGRDDFGNALRIGMYLLLLQARDENNNVFEQLKDVIVVARKL